MKHSLKEEIRYNAEKLKNTIGSLKTEVRVLK